MCSSAGCKQWSKSLAPNSACHFVLLPTVHSNSCSSPEHRLPWWDQGAPSGVCYSQKSLGRLQHRRLKLQANTGFASKSDFIPPFNLPAILNNMHPQHTYRFIVFFLLHGTTYKSLMILLVLENQKEPWVVPLAINSIFIWWVSDSSIKFCHNGKISFQYCHMCQAICCITLQPLITALLHRSRPPWKKKKKKKSPMNISTSLWVKISLKSRWRRVLVACPQMQHTRSVLQHYFFLPPLRS